MATVDLVFRSVGERTSELALDLAIRAIRPAEVHVIEDVRPLRAALDRMLRIEHRADYVVYVDADCLIFDDRLRPFIDRTRCPYVDCFVTDLFRGRLHCGVHITRADVVRAMAEVEVPDGDPSFLIRPESRRRNAALHRLGLRKEFRSFDIFHDWFQHYRDIFAKYAMRELRSRSPHQRERLEMAMAGWPEGPDAADFAVARQGVEHARATLPDGAGAAAVAAFVDDLPRVAAEASRALGLHEKGPLERGEVDELRARNDALIHRPIGGGRKIFGIGLSRTGTRSLNMALQILGYEAAHYPADEVTFEELASGCPRLSLLEDYDAVTDITVAPYYAQLDRIYPGSKFVLTVREREAWLASARAHWRDRPAFPETRTPEEEVYMKVRRLLRAAVYGCYEFAEERFVHVYETHLRDVRRHFAGRPDDLLVLDVCGGEGWPELCAFLARPAPRQPFPHKGRGLSRRSEALRRAG